MDNPIEKLHKFLRLEVERGYDDRAVVGGLRSVLESWEAEARAAELPNILIQAVTARLRDYHQLTPASREEILRGLWRRVTRSMKGQVPPLFDETASTERVEERRGGRTAPQDPSAGNRPAAPKSAPAPAPAPTPAPASQPADIPSRSVQKEESAAPVRGRRYPVPPMVSEEEAAALDAPLTVLSGIGPKTAERLEALHIRTLGDALYFFPRRYDDYSAMLPIHKLEYGQTVTIIGSVEQVRKRTIRGNRVVVEALISDGTGVIRATWFNQPWLADQLREAGTVSVSGKIDQYLGRLVLTSPEWEPLEKRHLHTHRIVPVYPLTANISQKWLRRKIHEVVGYWADRVIDPLPEDILQEADLMPLSTALKQIHYPDSQESLSEARHRLAFDEIFCLQLGVQMQRHRWTQRSARVFHPPDDWLNQKVGRLPYDLTGAQQKSLGDIRSDLQSGRPMNRLLQGDVGSGKTVVAALAIAIVAREGGQSAILAPTGILAEQHFNGLMRMLTAELGVLQPEEIALLTGATTPSDRRRILEDLHAGHLRLLIGTHALLEPDVIFHQLELIVIDEQHRFGVKQRATLREKGDSPHLLVMTATPIPRSLALTVYGDLDLSVMDEMPPGRQEVSTHLLRNIERERAYNLIEREVKKGRQAFIIYPLVEESESTEARAAVEEFERVCNHVFPKFKVALLHGRMTGDEKEAVMAAFRDGSSQILVSTAVVEVGVDVPNATVMLIEGANRFGLAQLHQFRGRVGRGAEKAYCLLIPTRDEDMENERLKALVETSDGFRLAEMDLDQRGPGEFLGVRQSGFSTLKMASITDVELIEKARRMAQHLYSRDPELTDPVNALLAEQVDRIWSGGEGDVS